MQWPEALEIVVVKTKHVAFRNKCSDENTNIQERDSFRQMMISMAQDLPIDRPIIQNKRINNNSNVNPSPKESPRHRGRRPSVRTSVAMIEKIKSCPHFKACGNGCGGNTCLIGKGMNGKVYFMDCAVCLDPEFGNREM